MMLNDVLPVLICLMICFIFGHTTIRNKKRLGLLWCMYVGDIEVAPA